MCIRRCAPALFVVTAVLTAAAACSQGGTEHPTGAAKERLAKAGLRVVIPRGWQGRIVRADRGFPSPAIEAANFRLAPVSASVVVPSPTGLTRSQVRLVLLETGDAALLGGVVWPDRRDRARGRCGRGGSCRKRHRLRTPNDSSS